ncbi:hypothetical protein ACFL3S_13380 [Gemmatimonadota bacterium]
MTFRDATDLLAVPLEEVARAVERTYGTVLVYRNGARTPPPEVMKRLAKFMKEQGRKLAEAADELGREGK